MDKLFQNLPGVYALIVIAATIIGGAVGGMVWRHATKAQRQALTHAIENTSSVYKAQSDALKSLMETQLHSAEMQLATMTKERDVYREKTHELASEMQAMALKLHELELKPDVSALYNAEREWHDKREAFYTRMFDTISTLVGAVQKLDERLTTELKGHSGACEKTSEAMVALVLQLQRSGVLKT